MFYAFLLAHLVADFILQPFWLVLRKRRWDGLLLHGSIVFACMLALGLVDRALLELWPAMLMITAIHTAADWWKVHRADRFLRPPIVPFLLDQALHIGTIAAVLSLWLPARSIWASSTLFATAAIYLSAYVVAACAVPIGITVWLDPEFAHAALARGARMRGLLFGVLGVSLVALVGVLALPALLLGFAAVVRLRISDHPLDTPAGAFTMLVSTTLLGALVELILVT